MEKWDHGKFTPLRTTKTMEDLYIHMTIDLMEEDDPMVEDIDEDEEDRFTQEHSRRMSLMRGSRAPDYYRSYPETLDEKGEPMAVMTPPEKLVHQNFFNSK